MSWYVLRYSGSMYPAVPLTWVEIWVAVGSSDNRAKPKSATLAFRFSVIKMFDALMSLWIIGLSVLIINTRHGKVTSTEVIHHSYTEFKNVVTYLFLSNLVLWTYLCTCEGKLLHELHQLLCLDAPQFLILLPESLQQ